MKKRNNDGKRGKTKNIKYMERTLIQDVKFNLVETSIIWLISVT